MCNILLYRTLFLYCCTSVASVKTVIVSAGTRSRCRQGAAVKHAAPTEEERLEPTSPIRTTLLGTLFSPVFQFFSGGKAVSLL